MTAVDMITPRLDEATERARSDFPALAPNAPFLLAYHPARWLVMRDQDGAFHCVPLLGRLSLEPGVDRVSLVGGRPKKSDAVAKWRRDGYHVLEQAGDYLAAVQVVGGMHYLTKWERAYPGDNRTETDVKAYVEWVHGIVDHYAKDGTPPAMQSLRRLRVQYAEQQLQAQEQAERSPRAAAKAAQFTGRIEAIDKAIDRWGQKRTPVQSAPIDPDLGPEDDKTPAPKTTSRRSKKTAPEPKED